MSTKYDLNKMLEEIEEDEKLEKTPKNIHLSQNEIKRMVAEKREGETP